MTNEEARHPGAGATGQVTDGENVSSSVTEWSAAYADARRWVAWTARRRWPAFPCNDDIWAASVADWHRGGRTGRAA